MAGRMHPDEIETSADLARRLVAAQFPQWADRPIEYVESGGTNNAILHPAWQMLSGDAREALRKALVPDDATRAGGRGWALSTAIVALPYDVDRNPSMVAMSRLAVEEVLADHRR